jgi:hypothetical protein
MDISEKSVAKNEEIDIVAAEIIKRRLAAPAIFILEMYKPLMGLMREVASFIRPLLLPLVGSRLVGVTSKILESTDSVEDLILKLEMSEAS